MYRPLEESLAHFQVRCKVFEFQSYLNYFYFGNKHVSQREQKEL